MSPRPSSARTADHAPLLLRFLCVLERYEWLLMNFHIVLAFFKPRFPTLQPSRFVFLLFVWCCFSLQISCGWIAIYLLYPKDLATKCVEKFLQYRKPKPEQRAALATWRNRPCPPSSCRPWHALRSLGIHGVPGSRSPCSMKLKAAQTTEETVSLQWLEVKVVPAGVAGSLCLLGTIQMAVRSAAGTWGKWLVSRRKSLHVKLLKSQTQWENKPRDQRATLLPQVGASGCPTEH